MVVPLEALVTAGAAIVGSVTAYGSTRFVAQRTQATEDRKVDLDEFDLFKKTYYEQIAEFKERYAVQEAKMTQVERLLKLALRHILDLRTDMRQHEVNPSHRTPPELEAILWTLTDDDPGGPGYGSRPGE